MKKMNWSSLSYIIVIGYESQDGRQMKMRSFVLDRLSNASNLANKYRKRGLDASIERYDHQDLCWEPSKTIEGAAQWCAIRLESGSAGNGRGSTPPPSAGFVW